MNRLLSVAPALLGIWLTAVAGLNGCARFSGSPCPCETPPAEAFFERGDEDMLRGDYDSAIEHYTVAIKADPEQVYVYLARGQAYLYSEKYEKAVADFSAVIDLAPRLADGYQWRGNAYRALGRTEEAERDFRRAAELNPYSSH